MSTESAPDESILTTAQVAQWTQLPLSAVRTAIREGRLPASLPAGRRNGYRIRAEAVRGWLDSFSEPGGGEGDGR